MDLVETLCGLVDASTGCVVDSVVVKVAGKDRDIDDEVTNGVDSVNGSYSV